MYGIVPPNPNVYESEEYMNPIGYGVGKAGIIQYSKYMSVVLAKYNITVNSISFGPFPDPVLVDDINFIKKLGEKTVLGRVGSSKEAVSPVFFLALDESSFITGQNIIVDGGVDMLVNNLILIQARLNSNRLPCKVLLDLSGKKTLLERCYDSVKAAKKIEKVIITTSTSEFDDVIYAKAKSFGAEVFRGELDNVLSRFYYAAKQYKPKNIIRITADNALMSGELIDELIGDFEEYSECDYMMYSEGVYGLSAEIFTYSSLEEAFHNTEDAYDCEHVTPYIHKHKLCLTPLIKEKI